MDKRILKTREAIYRGFSLTLMKKPYSKLTVEDILQASGVSRSTFYSHFKTKEDVLSSVSEHIFEHVFSHSLTEEKTHDFSKSSIFDYGHLVTHVFYHLHDEKELIASILSSGSRELFLENMRAHLHPIASHIVTEGLAPNADLPEDLAVSKVAETFLLCMEYWFSHDCEETPERISEYFFALNR